MYTLKINMKQFKQKWKVFQDNVDLFQTIIAANGYFVLWYPERYAYWLNEFGISFELDEDDLDLP